MDKQKIFTEAYLGLKAQGFQKSVAGVECKYRSDDGLKCAIGHLIPDHVYTCDIEGRGASRLLFQFDPSMKAVRDYFFAQYGPVENEEEDESFLCRLQSAHDSGIDRGEMERNLRDVAERYGLKVPE